MATNTSLQNVSCHFGKTLFLWIWENMAMNEEPIHRLCIGKQREGDSFCYMTISHAMCFKVHMSFSKHAQKKMGENKCKKCGLRA